ncbi:nitroreductase [Aspergillus keveii]|uniref:Nitroreductase n=1 Tax=Aspergillus keveii TaxID=714993 RepID=A0ABR4G5D9_9EURO
MPESLSDLIEARYRDPQSSTFPLPRDPFPDALTTILAHKSCRAFLPTPLPTGTLEALITAAQSASTSSLFQTWDAIAIQEPEHKSAIATLAGDQEFIRQAPLFLVFCPNLRRLTNLVKQYKPEEDAKALEGMDMFVMSTIDAALAAQNAAIAAEALGLGVCYAGALRNNADQVCKLLNLPPLTWGVFGMAIGYPDLEDRRSGRQVKPRLPMPEVLHMERWSETGQEGNVADYDRALGEFYVDEGKAGRIGWGEFVAGKVVPWEQDGRERIRGVIEGQGFKLK